jgi:hypothetical protein
VALSVFDEPRSLSRWTSIRGVTFKRTPKSRLVRVEVRQRPPIADGRLGRQSPWIDVSDYLQQKIAILGWNHGGSWKRLKAGKIVRTN